MEVLPTRCSRHFYDIRIGCGVSRIYTLWVEVFTPVEAFRSAWRVRKLLTKKYLQTMIKWKKQISEKASLYFFCCLYTFGILWFKLEITRDLFISSIPATLLLVIAIVFAFHKEWNKKTVLVFSSIATMAFVLELIGVSTGYPFGNYQYDRGLGWMLYETPLIIGLNWLFLVYASHGIAKKFTNNKTVIILLGASLMLGYDLILEAVAPIMQMWHFTTAYPPIQNFLSWFVVSAIFHSILVVTKMNVINYPARMLFIIQMGFFGLIAILGSFM
jgi:uncharacterized membrane protein